MTTMKFTYPPSSKSLLKRMCCHHTDDKTDTIHYY